MSDESVSRGQSNEIGYRIEARDAMFHASNPIRLWDGILSPEWREICLRREPNPAGIPDEPFGKKHEHGLVTYQAAVALAWTLIAQHRLRRIECRLVQYKLVTTHELTREGIVDGLRIENDLMPTVKLEPNTNEKGTE